MTASSLRIGLIGFGEAAHHLVAGLRETGLSDFTAHAHSERAAQNAERAQVRVGHADILRDRQVIFACVPGSATIDAARAAAPHVAAHALYVDLASALPDAKQDAATALGDAVAFVDAAILGSAVEKRHHVPLAASGPHARRFQDLFTPHGMTISVVGDQVGQAAALKLARSIFLKGIEALYVESLLVAGRLGVYAPVRDSIAQFLDARPAADTAEMLLRSHLLHAARRAEECDMSAALADRVGIAPVLASATAQAMRRTAGLGIGASVPPRPSTDQSITLLDTALGAPS